MMPYVMHRTRRGFGDAAQIVQQTSAIGTPVVLAGLSSSAASAAAASGTAATILGMAPALAIPVIGAAIAGITLGVVALLKSGCGQTCIVTSNWANQAEALLKQNIQAYFSQPAPRSDAQKAVALANFDSIWNYLVSQCGNAQLGAAGRNCISDRQAGACKWKQTADSVLLQYPGEPQPGECWNWQSGYRRPIELDSTVPDSPLSAAATGIQAAASSIGVSPALLVAGLGLLLVAGVMAQ